MNCGRPLHGATPPAATPPPAPQVSYTPPPPAAAGYAAAPAHAGAPPKNHLLLAIFSTLCCCLPLGIVAIIFGAQVNSKYASGDYAGAQAASANARKWAIIAIVLGILFQVIWMVFLGGSAFLETMRSSMGGY